MSDIIQLLPDSVANQIAAGEVIQRPASVVKELVENAVDAGATVIKVIIRDAGKTLIQVIDNGLGMSETDARMSFERHATSKIKNVDDLFCIRTMGFRGEALASIAAIAHVELRTKKENAEIGTFIDISGTDVKKQEPCSCDKGTNFSVKDLFFNVPARRKFLKADSTEFRHIIVEFQRVALVHPEIEMHLVHNDSEVFQLSVSNLKQRIVNIFGKSISSNLVDIKTETTLVKIFGFIGKPEHARKTGSEQYFFINGRFMKHPAFHKAVMAAYDKLILPESFPTYFIFLETTPESIDINIHPTKTEIKFENEKAIWHIIQACVKESLGKFNFVPSIDFQSNEYVDIPILDDTTKIKFPQVTVNPDYNPFQSGKASGSFSNRPKVNENWEKLYEGFEKRTDEAQQIQIPSENFLDPVDSKSVAEENISLFQIRNKFILSPVKSGLMIINQKRAMERIYFEQLLKTYQTREAISQQNLYPQMVELSADDCVVMSELIPEIKKIGFDINSFGKNTFIINGYPAFLTEIDWKEMIEMMIESSKGIKKDISSDLIEQIALVIARQSSNNMFKKLTFDEMKSVVDNLFQCSMPGYTPDGKVIVRILDESEIEKLL